MMKKRQAKLQLHRETVRALNQRDLQQALGGEPMGTSWTSCSDLRFPFSCLDCPEW